MFGLDPDTRHKIRDCFAQFPQIHKVLLYGSRAMGTKRPGSDVDISLIGKGLSRKNTLHPLSEALDDLLLPFTFDISIFTQLKKPELIQHILERGVCMYQAEVALKEGWEVKTLGDIGKVSMCKRILKKQTSQSGDIPFYKIGTFGKAPNAFIDRETYLEYKEKYSFPKNGDILISASGTIGRRVIYDGEPGYFQDSNIVWIDNNEELVSNDYLYQFYGACDWNPSKGATISRLYNNDLRRIKIPIPPLSEQEAIVEVLDTAFAAIDQAKANIEQNIANAKELFQSKLNQIFSQKGEGWVETTLITVTSFIDYRGRTPKKTEEGIRLLTAKNVRMGYLKRNPEEFIAEAAFDDWMTRGIPTKGDVLFTTEAPLANVTLLDTDEKIALAQRIITICPDRDILTGEYLSYCLQSKVSQDRILEKGTGATVTGIKAKLLKEIPIPIAPMDQQKSIIEELDSLSKSTKQLESHWQTKLASLDELKKSILQKAFAGELT
jgi:type I restriction enzyme S subunit